MTVNLLERLQKRDEALYAPATLQREQQTSVQPWRVLRVAASLSISHIPEKKSFAYDTEKYHRAMTDGKTRSNSQYTLVTTIAIAQTGLQSGSNHKIVLNEEGVLKREYSQKINKE